jgi:hypothetical protein
VCVVVGVLEIVTGVPGPGAGVAGGLGAVVCVVVGVLEIVTGVPGPGGGVAGGLGATVCVVVVVVVFAIVTGVPGPGGGVAGGLGATVCVVVVASGSSGSLRLASLGRSTMPPLTTRMHTNPIKRHKTATGDARIFAQGFFVTLTAGPTGV